MSQGSLFLSDQLLSKGNVKYVHFYSYAIYLT